MAIYNYAKEYIDVNLYSHKQYLAVLNMLQTDTEKIVLVQIDGPEEKDEVVNKACTMMELESTNVVSEWLGTDAPGRGAVEYMFKSNKAFLGYLRTLEAFFLWDKHPSKPHMGYTELRDTEFGVDDIAFLDKNNTILFYTTTHEGYAHIHPKYDDPILYFPK